MAIVRSIVKKIRIRNYVDVLLWAIAVTTLAVLVTVAIHWAADPSAPHEAYVWVSIFIAIFLAFPMSWFATVQIMYAQKSHFALRRVLDYDTMTGTLTRRRFFLEIEKDPDLTGTIAMADIDKFKAVNDIHGHLCGDEVLVHVAGFLSAGSRRVDLVARYGGEEFVMLFRGANMAESREIVDRIRRRIELSRADYMGQEIQVTISFGLAPFAPGMALDDALRKADDALYVAKTSGRNKCIMHDPISEAKSLP